MTSAATTALPFMDAFPAPDLAAWRAAVDKVLKGADFEKRLVSRSADGIAIQPLYPAAAPAARPSRGAAGRWRIGTRLDLPDPGQARDFALAELEGGADTLVLSFAGARAARGHGLAIEDVSGLEQALDGVMLDLIGLRLDPAPEGRVNALLVAALAERRGLQTDALTVDFGLDPIGVLASHGRLAAPWAEIGRRLAEVIKALQARGFAGPFVTVDARPYHEAGASEAQELGVALATAVAYLRALEAAGLPLAEARDALSFTLVADTDEFMTIAKFRAARLLWQRVQEACGLDPAPMRLHAETAWRSLTKRDPWVNLLRATVASFSAGIGGADSLTVLPFTAALGLPDGFARRVARNTQHVLLEEANLWRVADPAAGAGGFEALTVALCEKGWAAFQEIERQAVDGASGILAALSNGSLQGVLASQRAARLKAVATRREPITGTSEYPNLSEAGVDVLMSPSPAPARRSASPPTAIASQAEMIARLAAGAGRQDALMAAGQALSVEALPSQRLAEPFESLRDKADAAAKADERPAVFLAPLGRLADFTPRAGFARGLFAAGGLAAIVPDGFATEAGTDLEALAAAWRASGARLACLCGSDGAYEAEAQAAAEALTAAGATVWLAGRPGEREAAWKEAGITGYVFAGCDAVATLEAAQTVAMGLAE